MPEVRGHYRRNGTYVRPHYRRSTPRAYRDNGQVWVPPHRRSDGTLEPVK